MDIAILVTGDAGYIGSHIRVELLYLFTLPLIIIGQGQLFLI